MRNKLLERIKFLESNMANAQNVIQQSGAQLMQMQGAHRECQQMLKDLDSSESIGQVAQCEAPANEAEVAS